MIRMRALLGVALAAVIGIASVPASAAFNFVGSSVDMTSGFYQQGGAGKFDRQALTGSDGPLNGTGSDTNALTQIWGYTDAVSMTNSGFYGYNWLRINSGLNPGDPVEYVVQKLTNIGSIPDTYILWGEITSAANVMILAEAWNYTRNGDGSLTVKADLATGFPWASPEPVQRGTVGAYISTDWDGFTVDPSSNLPGGTWTSLIQIKDFPDGWHKPFQGFSVPAGITDDFVKAYNGEGTNGVGQGQHPGQGFGGLAQFQTAGTAAGVARGIDIYNRGPHGGFYGERRPTFGTIVPEPSTIVVLLGGLGAFAARFARRKVA